MSVKFHAKVRANGLAELICEHGVGHPSERLTKNPKDYYAVHCCDGCCGLPEFVAKEDALVAIRNKIKLEGLA